MSGYLAGTDSMFRQNGYGGTESHFGVGGQYDKNNDGTIYQWQLLNRQADAQYSGNAYATSIETSDGAHDDIPWSPKQLDALVRLAAWWCKETGNPARLVKTTAEHGFGYHSQFTAEWDHERHNCPGAPRVKQLKEVIIPRVYAILNPKPADVPMHDYIELKRTNPVPLTVPSSSLLVPSVVTLDFDEDVSDTAHHHQDAGGPSFVNGPRDFIGSLNLRLEAFPEGTEIQWRLYQIKSDGSGERVWTGPTDEFYTGGAPEGHTATTHKTLALLARVEAGRRLRFELTAMHEDLTLPQGWVKWAWLRGFAFTL